MFGTQVKEKSAEQLKKGQALRGPEERQRETIWHSLGGRTNPLDRYAVALKKKPSICKTQAREKPVGGGGEKAQIVNYNQKARDESLM